MNAFELTRTHEKIVAVVGISAGAVGLAILGISKKGPAKVLASAQTPIALDEKTAAQHLSAIAQHIASAGQDALKQYAAAGHHAPVKHVYAVLHSPWSEGRTISVEHVLDQEEKITDAHIASLARESLTKLDSDRASLLEATTIRVMLNGYPTADPVGKRARQIEVTSLVSTCNVEAKKTAQSAIEALFPSVSITWRSFTRAIITLFREASPHGQYLAIDMRADTTQLTSYHFGILEQRVVPEGFATLLARLSSGTPEETLSNVRMLARDACSTDACEKVQKAMALAEPELVRIFGEALSQLASPRRVSNELLLVTHPDLESWLTPFFARIDFSQFTMTTLPLNVNTPATIDMSSFYSGEMSDVALGVSCALVNIEEAA